MLTISGRNEGRYCDGVSRRNFLQIGGLGLAGFTLPNLLRAETKTGSSHKAVIHLFLGGGPSQSDIFPNLEAPDRYRTSFRRISTKIPGMPLCEHMPRVASMADKFVFIPGVHAMDGSHQPHCCFNGASMSGGGSLQEKAVFGPVGGRPSMGSYITKLQGSVDGITPPYMTLGKPVQGSGSGFLESRFSPFSPGTKLGGAMRLRDITLDELEDRARLLKSLDRLKADIDGSGDLATADTFSQRALDVIRSKKLAEALDLSKEDPKVMARYQNPGWGSKGFDSGVNLGLLRARRLVEAGARYVAAGYGGWDTHNANDQILAGKLPILDAGLATLVSDLEERGMLDDVTVLVWGEMGRGKPYSQPTKDAHTGLFGPGTGHWGECAPCFMAGGGMNVGQSLGKLDRHGLRNTDRPVHNHEVLATVYHNLGIDTAKVKVTDPAGRPHYLVKKPPIKELI